MLVEPARAKVNLYLHVVGRRADGYHLLDSLAVFPDCGDELRAEPSDALTLSISGPFGEGLAAEPDNLVLRAARGLAGANGVTAGAALSLNKRLPVSSGIGGGSADAAAALRLLSRLWGVPIPDGLAASLGADVPVCLASRPMRMGGIGDVLTPGPCLPTAGLLLVNPRVAVPTPAVFKARTGAFSAAAQLPAGWQTPAALAHDLAALTNDLERPARSICPDISDVLAWLRPLPGCLLARMSGSGATCFGLFQAPAEAVQAAAMVPPEWWAWGGALGAD